jgi:hypothetical protein
MNWTDDTIGGSEARAARAVGGRYEITCYKGGGRTWYDAIEETRYRIDYIPSRSTNKLFVRHPRGEPGTLAEAKRMAEEDHERRRRERVPYSENLPTELPTEQRQCDHNEGKAREIK